MARFTAEEAQELAGTPDAIMLTTREVIKLCDKHYADANELFADLYPNMMPDHSVMVDAGKVFDWLGY